MTSKDFLKKLALILETSPELIQPENTLESFQAWDSLALLSVISVLDQEFNCQLSTEEFAKIKTIGQLMQLVEFQAKDVK